MLKTISRRRGANYQSAVDRQSGLIETVFRYGPHALIVCLIAGAFLTPASAFLIDEAIYIEMARAMAETGSFSIASNGGVEDSPALLQHLTHEVDGQVYPQYPGAYGVIAAPFYAFFGINGLILMNALSTFAVAALTHRLAMRLFDDVSIARTAVILLLFATFVSTYAFSIWPHMMALALVTGAIERVAASAQHEGPPAWRAAMMSGLALGCAMALRVDAFLIAVAAVLWLRLFGAPSRRSLVLAFAAGLAPALIASALINQIKFGVPSPIAYGPPSTHGNHGEYGLQFMLLSVMASVLMLIDVSNQRIAAAIDVIRPAKRMATLIALVLAAALILESTRTWLWSMYVLTFDLQQLSETKFVPGVGRFDTNFITFWGDLKPALIQSLPFVAISIIPAAMLFRKGEASRVALLLAVIAAPIAFYGLRQWHGGYSLSMRYFLPAVPMLAILSAVALHQVKAFDETSGRSFVRAMALGAILLLGVVALLPERGTASFALRAYGPLLLALGLAAASGALIVTRHSAVNVRLAITGLAGLAVGWSFSASALDLKTHIQKLESQKPIMQALSEKVAPDSIVFTTIEEWFVSARQNGVHITNPRKDIDRAGILTAFVAADRCVFLLAGQPEIISDFSQIAAFEDVALAPLSNAPMEFRGLRSQEGRCF